MVQPIVVCWASTQCLFCSQGQCRNFKHEIGEDGHVSRGPSTKNEAAGKEHCVNSHDISTKPVEAMMLHPPNKIQVPAAPETGTAKSRAKEPEEDQSDCENTYSKPSGYNQ
mmetsp:Transcript_58082/g.106855  ORF Transcript_58082/g.106855 Transcript_58082/m.106855 type:complete len:111 (+) Transcript_58082:261-593(+)